MLDWLSTSPSRLKSYVYNRVVDTIERIPADHNGDTFQLRATLQMLRQGELKQQNLSVFSYGGKDLLGYFYQNGHATETGKEN